MKQNRYYNNNNDIRSVKLLEFEKNEMYENPIAIFIKLFLIDHRFNFSSFFFNTYKLIHK